MSKFIPGKMRWLGTVMLFAAIGAAPGLARAQVLGHPIHAFRELVKDKGYALKFVGHLVLDDAIE